MKSTVPAKRCLVLLKDLRKKLDETSEWNDAGEEIEELIREIEEELDHLVRANKNRTIKDSGRLKILLLTATSIIRLILNIP